MSRNVEREMLRGNWETLVLALLARGEGYGYQMRKDLAIRSRNTLQIGFGRLYPVLATLERRGLARARWVKTPGSREHKHYVITPKGLAEFQSRKRSWRQFSQGMDFVLSDR